VYFRISEDEFFQLSQLCEEQGARSLSDMARIAMQNLLHQPPPENTGVSCRLDALERILTELADLLRVLMANRTNGKDKCSDRVV
jgi:hypothetical protein